MKKLLSFLTLVSFLITGIIGPLPAYALDAFRLPAPGIMVHLSPAFEPAVLKGIKVHPENPFEFDFILDKGNRGASLEQGLQQEQLKKEATKLIKYFLAGLTIPEKDLWVNLSPYEKDRIIPQSFGLTEMGRDLLAEDYMLKQITASLIYPEDRVGKKFWKRIYAEASKRYGTTDIPVNTFNKVWIVPEKAVVYENPKAGTAYVMESKLKVMLEEDYLSQYKHAVVHNDMTSIGSNIVREIVIPELTREVNANKNFAQLRQVYNSLILASWYKMKIKNSILEQVYANKNKVAGVKYDSSVIDAGSSNDVEKIYQRYLQAFKMGAYNYIKEEQDLITKEPVPRKYFSGGFAAERLFKINGALSVVYTENAALPSDEFDVSTRLDNAMNATPPVELPNNLTIAEKEEYINKILREFTWRNPNVTEGQMRAAVSTALDNGGRLLADYIVKTSLHTVFTYENPTKAVLAVGEAVKRAGNNAPYLLQAIVVRGMGTSTIPVDLLAGQEGREQDSLLSKLIEAFNTAGPNAKYLAPCLFEMIWGNFKVDQYGIYAQKIAKALSTANEDVAKNLRSNLHFLVPFFREDNMEDRVKKLCEALENAGTYRSQLYFSLNAVEEKLDSNNVIPAVFALSNVIKKFKFFTTEVRAQGKVKEGIGALATARILIAMSHQLTPENLVANIEKINLAQGDVDQETDEYTLYLLAAIHGNYNGIAKNEGNSGFLNFDNLDAYAPQMKEASRAAGTNASYLPAIVFLFFNDPRMTAENAGIWTSQFAQALSTSAEGGKYLLANIEAVMGRLTEKNSGKYLNAIALALNALGKNAEYLEKIIPLLPSDIAEDDIYIYTQAIVNGLNRSGKNIGYYKDAFGAVSGILTKENVGDITLQLADDLNKAGQHVNQVEVFLREIRDIDPSLLPAIVRKAAGDKSILQLYVETSSKVIMNDDGTPGDKTVWKYESSKNVIRDILGLLSKGRHYETVKQFFVNYFASFLLVEDAGLGGSERGSLKLSTERLIDNYSNNQLVNKDFLAGMNKLLLESAEKALNKALDGKADHEKLTAFIKKVMADQGLREKLFNLVGLYYRISGNNPDTSVKIQQTILHFVENGGDVKALNLWLYAQSEWNKDIYDALSKIYKKELWQGGFRKTLPAQSGGVDPIQRMRDQTWQLYEIAKEKGVPNLPPRENGVGFDTYTEAKAFAETYLLDSPLIIEKQPIKGILQETELLDRTIKESKVESGNVTVEIDKDLLEDSYSGVGVAGCFNPLTGAHMEMPPQHALKANELFLRVRFEGRVVANAVLLLTEKGMVVQKLYESIALNLNVNAAVFDALAQFVKDGWAPAILGQSDSVGFKEGKKYFKAIDPEIPKVSMPKILQDTYYSDMSFTESEGRLEFKPTHIMDAKSLEGYVLMAEAKAGAVPVAQEPAKNTAAKRDEEKAGIKTKARETLFALSRRADDGSAFQAVQLGPVLGKLERILFDNEITNEEISTDVSNLKNKDKSVPLPGTLAIILDTVLKLREGASAFRQETDEAQLSMAASKTDEAMFNSTKRPLQALNARQNGPGGIDLTVANIDLQVQNTNGEIKFHLDPAQLAQLQDAPGFVPVILNIRPVQDLRSFLGLQDNH